MVVHLSIKELPEIASTIDREYEVRFMFAVVAIVKSCRTKRHNDRVSAMIESIKHRDHAATLPIFEDRYRPL